MIILKHAHISSPRRSLTILERKPAEFKHFESFRHLILKCIDKQDLIILTQMGQKMMYQHTHN